MAVTAMQLTLDQPRFSQADIANGATLVLTMGLVPNKAWSPGPADAPPSMTAQQGGRR